jgi:FkbM family methyltransferase
MGFHFGQEGEDLIIARFFGEKSEGTYVDIGSHHPFRFSNTAKLYKKGWSGINVDPLPGSKSLFDSTRRRDKNLEVGVGLRASQLTYYAFNEPALNSFSEDVAKRIQSELNDYHLEKEITIDVFTLDSILTEYLEPVRQIDYLNIDVEGLDLEVLQSNNWDRFKPTLISIEIWDSSINSLDENQTHKYLSALGYELYAKTVNTVFYRLTE